MFVSTSVIDANFYVYCDSYDGFLAHSLRRKGHTQWPFVKAEPRAPSVCRQLAQHYTLALGKGNAEARRIINECELFRIRIRSSVLLKIYSSASFTETRPTFCTCSAQVECMSRVSLWDLAAVLVLRHTIHSRTLARALIALYSLCTAQNLGPSSPR